MIKNILILLLIPVFSFSQDNIVLDTVRAVVLLDKINVYENPDYNNKVGFIQKNDTIEVVGTYLGKPYTKIRFWEINYNNAKRYITAKGVSSVGKRKLYDIIDNINDKRIDSLIKLKKEKDSILFIEYKNTCHFIKNEIDEFNGIKRIVTDFYKVSEHNKNVLNISLRRYGNQKTVVFESLLDLGCASPYSNDKSYVKVKLENGTIVTVYHRDDINCGNFILVGILTNNDIIKLKQSPIKTIRLSGTKYYNDIKDIEFKDFFIKKLECIK